MSKDGAGQVNDADRLEHMTLSLENCARAGAARARKKSTAERIGAHAKAQSCWHRFLLDSSVAGSVRTADLSTHLSVFINHID